MEFHNIYGSIGEIRIAALNASDSSSEDEDKKFNHRPAPHATKEAQENAAFTLYNKGLGLQKQGRLLDAEKVFKQVLENPFVIQDISDISEGESLQPHALLRYSAHKNVANIAATQDRHDDAIESLLEAVAIDPTDVTVWYRLGVQAKKISHIQLSCKAFDKGLLCSPSHWPCLDGAITMLYATDNYELCMARIAESLEKDPGYVKGLVIRKAILDEQPCINSYTKHLFTNCKMSDVEKYTSELTKEEIAEYVDEVVDMREKRKMSIKKTKPEPIPLRLNEYSWVGLGRRLIELYEYVEKTQTTHPELTIWTPVDVNAPFEEEGTGDNQDRNLVAQSEPVIPMETDDQVGTTPVITPSVEPLGHLDMSTVGQSNLPSQQLPLKSPGIQVMEIESASRPLTNIKAEQDVLSEPQAESTVAARSSESQGEGMLSVDRSNSLKAETQFSDSQQAAGTSTDASETHTPLVEANEVHSPIPDQSNSESLITSELVAPQETLNTPVIKEEHITPEYGHDNSSMSVTELDKPACVSVKSEHSTGCMAEKKPTMQHGPEKNESQHSAASLLESGTTTSPSIPSRHISTPSPAISILSSLQGSQSQDSSSLPHILQLSNEKEAEGSSTTPAGEHSIHSDGHAANSHSIPEELSSHSNILQEEEFHSLELPSCDEPSMSPSLPLQTIDTPPLAHNTSSRDESIVSQTSHSTSVLSLKLEYSDSASNSQLVGEAYAAAHTPENANTSSNLVENINSQLSNEPSHKEEIVTIQHNAHLQHTSETSIHSINTSDKEIDDFHRPIDGSNDHSQSPGLNVLDANADDQVFSSESVDIPKTVPKEIEGIAVVKDTVELMNIASDEVPAQKTVSAASCHSDHMYAKSADTEVKKDVSKGLKRKRSSGIITSDDKEKRRSARVRSTVASKNKIVVKEHKRSFSELIEELLPAHLIELGMPKPDENEEAVVLIDKASNTSPVVAEPVQGLENEKEEITAVLSEHTSNQGVGDLLEVYIFALSEKMHAKWPSELISLFINTFLLFRKHIQFPDCHVGDGPEAYMHKLSKTGLLWLELTIDHAQQNATNLKSFPGPYLDEDVYYWNILSTWPGQVGKFWPEFCIRLFWVSAKYHLLKKNNLSALESYNKTLEYLTVADGMIGKQKYFIVNLKCNARIDEQLVKQQISNLERTQSLEQVQELHHRGDHSRVIELLLPTLFGEVAVHNKDTRHEQLLLLMEAFLKVPEHKDGLHWVAAATHEAWMSYRATNNKDSVWQTTYCSLVNGLNKLLTDNEIERLSPSQRAGICTDMVQAIDHCMSTPDNEKSSPVPTLIPWVILYQMIKHDKKTTDYDHRETPSEPLELKFINFAHDQLGQRSWCTLSAGVIPHLQVEACLQHLKTVSCPPTARAPLNMHIEQCFYCLYGHPSKKTRAKHLEDHEVGHLQLSWDHIRPLFEYWKPKSVPEFDSYRSSTISAEVEILFKRITSVVPGSCQPSANVENRLTTYLDKGLPISVISEQTKSGRSEVTGELYYLLADYYFKNKEPIKAIKHYILDICFNPRRFDSWAGMALAKSCRLETRLGMMEQQNYCGEFQKLVVSTLQSFKRALDLNPENDKLWIEYGSSAYQVHSYASRYLKTKSEDLSATEEFTYNKLEREMLEQAKDCFIKASEIDDDDGDDTWLHHYMLGKISEKMKKPAYIPLLRYKLSAECLHENGANYPMRINYMYNPPHLAVEALEMHYRIHASILKYLTMKNCLTAPVAAFRKALNDASKSSFATAMADIVQRPTATKRTRSLSESDKSRAPARKISRIDTPIMKAPVAAEENDSVQGVINLLLDAVEQNLDRKGNEATNYSSQSMTQAVRADLTASTECADFSIHQCMDHILDTIQAMSHVLDQVVTRTEQWEKIPEQPLNSQSARKRTFEEEIADKDLLAEQAIDEDIRRELINDCVKGLKLCIQRYPLHYKSYYRLAQLFNKDKQFKDSSKVQDLLMGSNKLKEEKFTAQGLFQDRKTNNFFNGVWRIPIQEIERAGSFGAHLYRTIHLLLNHLLGALDYNLLYNLHQQLQKSPGSEKKFLKDADRSFLANESMEFAVKSFYKVLSRSQDKEEPELAAYLQLASKWYKHGVRFGICVPNVQVLFIKACKTYKLATDSEFDSNHQCTLPEARDLCNKLAAKGKEKGKPKECSVQLSDVAGPLQITVSGAGAQPGETSVTTKQVTQRITKASSAATVLPRKPSESEQKSVDTVKECAGNPLSDQPLNLSRFDGLPAVRGSFSPFTPENQSKKPSESSSGKTDKVPDKDPKPVATTSWLHKAKDGSQTLASMFNKRPATPN